MITAVDTNVLLDVFDEDPEFMQRSLAALRRCEAEGGLIASDIVWAELAARFPSPEAARAAMGRVNIDFAPMKLNAALEASTAWGEYRERGGPRTRVVADFLIGAHASVQADRLLTRDRRFHGSYFEHLEVMDPTA